MWCGNFFASFGARLVGWCLVTSQVCGVGLACSWPLRHLTDEVRWGVCTRLKDFGASLEDLVAWLGIHLQVGEVYLNSSGLVQLLQVRGHFDILSLTPVCLPSFQPLLHDEE